MNKLAQATNQDQMISNKLKALGDIFCQVQTITGLNLPRALCEVVTNNESYPSLLVRDLARSLEDTLAQTPKVSEPTKSASVNQTLNQPVVDQHQKSGWWSRNRG